LIVTGRRMPDVCDYGTKIAVLGYLLTAGKATVAECEEELKMNRRTLQRDLKVQVEKGLVREVGTGPTDPPNTTSRYCDKL
jgi:DeoR/GlpR family transcriptional regulator of sugar metabolism